MGDKMKPDMTDDWMNPPPREPYKAPVITYPRFLIQRKRRLDHVPFEEWRMWSSYETASERDAALSTLREEHPAWVLQTRDEYLRPMSYN